MAEAGFLNGACESCGGHIEFPAEGIGMSVSCPHCGQMTALLEDLGPREMDQAISASDLSAAFLGAIPKYRVSVIYQIALLLVSSFMVVLPLLYFGLIAALGYGIYRYAVAARALLTSYTGGLYI